ncbi:heterokaryon incompatibility protein-domain-containing protein [Apodospora peruviana]|uniref:Heterokaryon incompatibility protein-domain-containing protein n=1 Tax=Apodospora peruviana TaxID=516989 RepID=A0AAE0HU08_9PEZI|nr:heterokaryon incompatibility protein-domain-containing protein [Apodospora peruviana]
MESYTYSPLPAGHIRLVSVAVNAEHKLSATIKHVAFDEKDPIVYSALSYVWGEPLFTVPMRCDDGASMLKITPTLHDALLHATKFSPNEDLWIDQICINQKDDAERSEQVKMMTSIYNYAKTVIAYVGPSGPSTDRAVDLITRVGTMAGKMAGDMFRWDDEQSYTPESLKSYEKISYEQSTEMGIPFHDTESWDAFSEFYDRKWYQRIWIVQEILPSRHAVVVCGSHSVKWEHVKHAAAWYHYKAAVVSGRHKRKVDGIQLTQGMDLTWNLRLGSEYLAELMGQKTGPTHRWTLQRLLTAFRGREATDPRDKVYALVGLSDLAPELSGNEKGLRIDYGKDVKTVFTEAARAIIGTENLSPNLDVLLAARRTTCACAGEPSREEQEGWPSWVPDWRRHFGWGCQWGVGWPIEEWSVESYKAGKHTNLDQKGDDIFTLRVRGKVLGRVIYASPHAHVSEMLQNDAIRKTEAICLDMLQESLSVSDNRYLPTGQPIEVAFAMTLIGNRFPKTLKEKGVITEETYAENYLGFLDSLLMPKDTEEERTIRERTGLPYYDKYGFDNDWIEAVMHAVCERRFYVTDTGLIGLGNHYMREGDVVVKLVGMSLPCVLRPRRRRPYGVNGNGQEGYEFIGEAYCHGEMGGLQPDGPGSLSEETLREFVLQ